MRRPFEPRLSEAADHVLGDMKSATGGITLACAITGVLVLFLAVALLVYLTGGTQTAYLHLAYLPILLAASVFGVAGGVAAGLFAGVGVVGPLMPIDTATGASQPLASWLFRLGFFLLIGIVAGLVVGRLRQHLERIRAASLWHPVSGLPTQLALEHMIEEILRRSKRDDRYGLIKIDVRNYDQIFNTLGPEIAQHLPAAIGERLRPLFPAKWQVFHVHAGRVAVLLTDPGGSETPQAKRVAESLRQPVVINDVPVYLDAAAGIARFGDADESNHAIRQRANIAVAEARTGAQMIAHYDEIRTPDKERTMHLLTDAASAVELGQFVLAYQPQIRLSDGRIVGAEALVRWQHPTLGLLSPGRFIPLLEETALINQLTFWVARTAIRQAAHWRRAGVGISVAFNVSPRNMDDAHLTEVILQELERYKLEANAVEVELTESAIIDDGGMIGERLAELKAAGVTVALDDFGAGYTSVRHLTGLPIDKLKIDRSLIGSMMVDARQGRIVTGLMSLAHDIGLQTVAEGVEDAETEKELRAGGCHFAQGFYYSKPVTPDEILQGPEKRHVTNLSASIARSR